MRPDFSELYAREMAVIPIVNDIERRGIVWDWQRAIKEDAKITAKMETILESDAMAGVNPGSWQQVLAQLQALGMPLKLITKKGKPTTAAKVVEAGVRHLEANEVYATVSRERVARIKAFYDALSDYRGLKKISSTYLRPYSLTAQRTGGFIFPSINPADTITGRMSGTMQQMPKAENIRTHEQNVVRECVVCREGYATYYFDYAQMELYVFGALAGEQRILDAYDDGEDLHQTMADAIGQERTLTKNITFGILYGEGVSALADVIGKSVAEAKDCIELYMTEFPSIRSYQDELKETLAANGEMWDWFGKRYQLRAGEAYMAVNAIVQGMCAQVFKTALIQTAAMLEEDEHIILPVHDELQIERHLDLGCEGKFVTRIKAAFENIDQLTDRGLRLKVDVEKTVTTWAAKEKVMS